MTIAVDMGRKATKTNKQNKPSTKLAKVERNSKSFLVLLEEASDVNVIF